MDNRLLVLFLEVAMDNGKDALELEQREQERVALGLLMTLGDFVLKHKRNLGDLIRYLQVVIADPDFVKILDAPREVVAKAVEKVEAALLTFAGTINVLAVKAFWVSNLFVVNTNESARVRISYVGDNFKKLFGHMVKSHSGSTLSYHTLTRNAYDSEIVAVLGGEAAVESTIPEIWWLMMQQPNGPKSPAGALLTNGCANIFYVRGQTKASALRAVGVRWGGYGWDVSADELNCHGWYVNGRVFVPAYSSSLSDEDRQPQSR